jgi:chondroitin 4-sulfotransferase 11
MASKPKKNGKILNIMALINDEKKFIFFHLYKCGGMSFRKSLNEAFPNSYEIQGGHSLPKDFNLKGENGVKYRDYYRFTMIRNPFDFMVSTYFYGKSYSNHFMHDDIIKNEMGMEEFIPYYFKHKENDKANKLPGQNKVVTIKDWLHDDEGNIVVDKIMKIETMESDIRDLSVKLGSTININQTNVNPNRDKNYRKYYTPISRKMIEEKFDWELNEFDYEF